MKTITFRGKDEADIERQLWDWRQANPKAVIITRHPIERRPLQMKPVTRGAKSLPDLFSIRIDCKD